MTTIDQAGTLPARILDALADGEMRMAADIASACNSGPGVVRTCLRYLREEGLVRMTRPRNRGEHWYRTEFHDPQRAVLAERGRKGAEVLNYRRSRKCHACGSRMAERPGSLMLLLVCPQCDARRQLSGEETASA